MDKHFPTLLDRPETGNIVSAVTYSILAFFSLPFLLLLFMQGSFGNEKVAAGMEIFYHVVNFLVAAWIYRAFLGETFLDVRCEFRKLMKAVSTSTGLIFLFALVLHAIFAFSDNKLYLTAYGVLPLAEMDLFALSSSVVSIYPVLGTLCMTLLAPITISCLYYATVFAPVCYTRPVLAYVAMTAFLIFPRFCNAVTYWNPAEEMLLFAAQLPVHLIACRAYQKADSIWAPILTHMIVNLLSCLLIILNGFMAGL